MQAWATGRTGQAPLKRILFLFRDLVHGFHSTRTQRLPTMKITVRHFAFILFYALFLSGLPAQNSRFGAGIVAGLNFAELEGDGITDYFGLNAGLIGTARISRHAQLGMEILFSQNGEYILPESYPYLQYGQVRLNHLEIPLHIDWLIGVFKRDDFYDWNLNLGVAYTRLLTHQVEDVYHQDVSNQVIYGKRDAFLLQAGTTFHFTKRLGLNLKTSLPIRVEGLNWTLAARIVYLVSGPTENRRKQPALRKSR